MRMPNRMNVLLVATGTMWLSGASSQAQTLVGSSTTVGGLSTLVTVDQATGATVPFMTVPVPAGFELRYISQNPTGSGCKIAGTIYRGDTANNRSRLMRIDPATKTSSMVEFGAPLNSSYAEGFDWSPRHNAFMIGYTSFGSFASNRLALVNESGAVLATSPGTVGASDIDTLNSSTTRDIIFDLNSTSATRVFQLTALFPTPAVGAFATPPSLAGFQDGAIHPTTEELTFSNAGGTQLLKLVGNTYVNGPVIQGGVALRGLGWVNLPPVVVAGGDVIEACPSGRIEANARGVGDAPLAVRWERETSPGVFVALENGPTDSWDGGAAGVGGIVSGATTPTLVITADSANGRYLSSVHAIAYRCVFTNGCGSARSVPSIVTLRECAYGVCIADYDASGGTPDTTDIGVFFVDWLEGAACADADCSGGTPDGTDIEAFFAVWLAGGC